MEAINCITKEIVAKLLAQENINVQHKNMPTAAFDIKTRTLYLPIYKNITENVYDLFVSHECSHALHTPYSEWDKAVVEKKSESFKMVVNVVEDARVDKLIKRKFPGLGKIYSVAYKELFESDFFGTKGKIISDYHFIDRLNLHFKSLGSAIIPFLDEEKIFVEKTEKLETFSEVLKLSEEIYNVYFKEKEEKRKQKQKEEEEKSDAENEDSEYDEFSSQNQEYDEDDLDDENQSNSKSGSKSREQTECADEQLDSQNNSCGAMDDDDEEPETPGDTLKTQETNIGKYIENSTWAKDPTYFNLPEKIYLNKILVEHKIVHKFISDHYSEATPGQIPLAELQLKKFHLKNDAIINYLVKEFEMKKSADAYSRTKPGRTGSINTNKLYSYKFNENIFKRMTDVPKGKSHGLVIFVDCSSSMYPHFASTLEQTMVLAWFCKKVFIPFRIYGFSDNSFTRIFNKEYPKQESTVDMSCFYLKEYFSSDMTSSEFQKACINLHCLMNFFHFGYLNNIKLTLPDTEVLSGTPLNVAIIAAAKIINEFQYQKNLQKVNTIFLTDGCSHPLILIDDFGRPKYDYCCNVIFRHLKTKKEYKVDASNMVTQQLFKYLKDETQVNIIGFYIINSLCRRCYIKQMIYGALGRITDLYKSHIKTFFKEGQLYMKNILGYDEYYILASQDLEITEGKNFLDNGDQKMNNRKMATVLSKSLNNKLKNRIILSKFIEKIA